MFPLKNANGIPLPPRCFLLWAKQLIPAPVRTEMRQESLISLGCSKRCSAFCGACLDEQGSPKQCIVFFGEILQNHYFGGINFDFCPKWVAFNDPWLLTPSSLFWGGNPPPGTQHKESTFDLQSCNGHWKSVIRLEIQHAVWLKKS